MTAKGNVSCHHLDLLLTRLQTGFPCRGREFFSSPPCPGQLWGLPSLLFSVYWGVNGLGCETDHLFRLRLNMHGDVPPLPIHLHGMVVKHSDTFIVVIVIISIWVSYWLLCIQILQDCLSQRHKHNSIYVPVMRSQNCLSDVFTTFSYIFKINKDFVIIWIWEMPICEILCTLLNFPSSSSFSIVGLLVLLQIFLDTLDIHFIILWGSFQCSFNMSFPICSVVLYELYHNTVSGVSCYYRFFSMTCGMLSLHLYGTGQT
jgi:hypothetical protein